MTEIRAEAIWARALAHPLRGRVLRHMVHVPAQPVELAARWQVDADEMRKHFRRLRELGVIEPRNAAELDRGAHRLCDLQATEEALWRLGAPVPARYGPRRLAARVSTIRAEQSTAVERLQARRQQLELPQVELSRRAGLHSETVGRIERGETDPRLSVVLVLADDLCYPPEQLFEGAHDLRPTPVGSGSARRGGSARARA